MNNITKTQASLTEASETNIDLPSYIQKEVEKIGKIFNKSLKIDEHNIWDGIHGIITGIKVSGNKVVKVRMEKSDFSKLAKIKGLRWMETSDEYITIGWDHK